MVAPAPSRCRFDGWDAPGAPEVWALRHSHAARASPEAERSQMRQAARDALSARLAAVFDVPAAAIDISRQRGAAPRARWQPCAPADDAALAARLAATGLSISHEAALSVIAWHPEAEVGLDIVRVPTEAAASELWRTATLYLPPAEHAELAACRRRLGDAGFAHAFARAWAAHEARLKLAGLALTEWHGALAGAWAGAQVAAVPLPRHLAPWPHAASVAWCPVAR